VLSSSNRQNTTGSVSLSRDLIQPPPVGGVVKKKELAIMTPYAD
jgi:hypothetical protein